MTRFKPPGRVEAAFSRMLGRLLALGAGPRHMFLLEVRGRRTGRLFVTPVDPLSHDGVLYLVAPRGETQWVRNARAAGRLALRRGRTRREYDVEALDVGERAPVLRAYLDAYRTEVQRYFSVPADAPEAAFAKAAGDYPVLRLKERA